MKGTVSGINVFDLTDFAINTKEAHKDASISDIALEYKRKRCKTAPIQSVALALKNRKMYNDDLQHFYELNVMNSPGVHKNHRKPVRCYCDPPCFVDKDGAKICMNVVRDFWESSEDSAHATAHSSKSEKDLKSKQTGDIPMGPHSTEKNVDKTKDNSDLDQNHIQGKRVHKNDVHSEASSLTDTKSSESSAEHIVKRVKHNQESLHNTNNNTSTYCLNIPVPRYLTPAQSIKAQSTVCSLCPEDDRFRTDDGTFKSGIGQDYDFSDSTDYFSDSDYTNSASYSGSYSGSGSDSGSDYNSQRNSP